MGGIGAPELIVICFLLAFPVIGYVVGARRGRSTLGLLLGFLLGPIGWLVLLIIPPANLPKCPDCKGDVISGATKCKNCGSTLPSPAT
jgi:hypothetical protein